MSTPIQLTPIQDSIYERLETFCVEMGVTTLLGFADQGVELPTLPDGSYAPCATFVLGEPFEVPTWQSLDDGPGQMAILDFTVLVSANSARALTITRDVVVAALDAWVPPGCGRIRQIDSVARTPVDSYLMPAKFAKPLGFMCTIGL